MYKHWYQQFNQYQTDTLWFTAHSHHFWPDVTLQAMMRYWHDSARLVDDKWQYIFSSIIPKAQRHISRLLNYPYPEQVTFAPSTHELLVRLISCFPARKKLTVLTTDSEFYSFSRQLKRLNEEKWTETTVVNTEPFNGFIERFYQAANTKKYDIIFFSHTFFNSGYTVQNLNEVIEKLSSQCSILIVDGYHSFAAIPVDLSEIANNVFFLAGGYKYAQSGEGCCFLLSPPKANQLRPWNTGWFANFSQLEESDSSVIGYDSHGQRFAGATFDPTGIYRLNAVFDLWQENKITVETVHQHVFALQQAFLQSISTSKHPLLNYRNLLYIPEYVHGHFLTFKLADREICKNLSIALNSLKVKVDCRDNRIRFGFGLQHDLDDINQLLVRLKRLPIA
ncbi:aminotransferase class V-fold PLP-dependent enzyme [Endozoicomonas sp. SM1973]|uniref:Aminotransferase class V-fold PLP-dependent enzyme n=1 Tax=Spartinivicinus marinus TaxID=2994442 RepID=A0A853I849_9GAMM|nr:aminotransferase class V-fold PLP-dependent enzyme [Spartinivicinus marinus]MCX4026456.1 aminotransferase class V-fold PLP-dependent enzyme [Spartinivicinus marinus]NYZ66828.1 aminotransferase class V-fold PLP-dependent enzyme [Spartinivicinus marinus]